MPDSPAQGDSGVGSSGIPWRTLGVAWALMIVAAAVYANLKNIPFGLAIPAALAFAVEVPFYLMAGAPPAWLRRPAILAGTCLLPYLVYSIPSGTFGIPGLVLLAALALVLSYWYIVLPRHAILDLLYVALLATVLLSKVFDRVYISAIPKVPLSVLGHLMLIRTAAIAMIGMRGVTDAQYVFIPKAEEWLAGLKWFVFMLPAVLTALWAVGLWLPRENPKYWVLIPQFFGILWVVALSEGFFFRGLLQNWFEGWSGNRVVGLLVSCIMFGAAHLWFHRQFPNWRFAIVATIFGLFCGLAFREKRSVPASMVTHAMGASLYQVFFQ